MIPHQVKSCSTCAKYGNSNQKEPMIPHQVPERPWQEVGADYFTLHTQDYLLVVDMHSPMGLLSGMSRPSRSF